MTELLNAHDVKAWLDGGGTGPVVIQGIDLRPFARPLVLADLKGSSLLGCAIEAVTQQQADKQGGIVIPETRALPDPLRCFPTELYDAAFLYRGFDPTKDGSWVGTPDNLGWKFFMKDSVLPNTLDMAQMAAARLHDSALERAVARFLTAHGRPAVAIMGGHDLPRTDKAFRQVVEISRALRRKGYMIVTGGGPGLMEAGNLGAFLADQKDDAIDVALAALPEKDFKTHAWLATAAEVRAKFNKSWSAPISQNATSLAIPTWLYGHEPPNLFSSHIGKLF